MGTPLEPGVYAFDPNLSQLGFRIGHLGLTPIRGLFAGYDGRLVVGDRPEATSLEVTVDLASVQSGHAGRDEHLLRPEWFDSAVHPTMTYRSARFVEGPSGWTIEGDLTLKGTTRPLALDAVLTGRRVSPLDGKEHIGVTASGVLARMEFDVGSKVPAAVLDDEVRLELAVHLLAAST